MKKRFLLMMLLVCLFLVGGCTKEEITNDDSVVVESKELTDKQIDDLMKVVNDLKYMDYYNKDIVPRKLTNQEALRISYEILASEGRAQSGKLKFTDLESVALNYLGLV